MDLGGARGASTISGAWGVSTIKVSSETLTTQTALRLGLSRRMQSKFDYFDVMEGLEDGTLYVHFEISRKEDLVSVPAMSSAE